MGPLPQRKHCLIMLQVLFLVSLASAVPAPEADPLLYTGHPLTYSVPYVTYHAPTCKTEVRKAQREQAVRAAKDQKKATVKKPVVKDKAAQKAQKATKNVQKAGPGRVGGKR